MSKKILVVEDEKDIAGMVHDLLTKSGYEIIVANDGQEGLKRLETFRPDLILLDVMMPQMSGYDFVRTVKQDEKFKQIPVIVLTAKALSYEAFKKEGVTDYLLKPFLPAELTDKIQDFFTRKS